MTVNIPITRPCFDEDELQALREVLDSGWVSQGPATARFEALFAEYAGAGYAVACSSCTTGLHLCLAALGIGPGDEVIVPSFTYVATANVVEYMGARPVFVDIDLDTYNIDSSCMASAITPRTRAVIPVHLFGLCADMEAVGEVCRRHGLAVVEDAACAIGALFHGRHAGTFGAFGCFSFHPRKVITTGEGGMVTSNGAEPAEKIRSLRNHGAGRCDLKRHEQGGSLLPEFDVLGYNYRMTDLQAAIGCVQMRKLNGILEERRRVALAYLDALKDIDWLCTPVEPEGLRHGWQSFVCRFEKEAFGGLEKANLFRNGLMARLESQGIATRQGTHAVHTLGYYRGRYGLAPQDLPNSLEADRLTMTLPLFPGMGAETLQRVVEAILAERP